MGHPLTLPIVTDGNTKVHVSGSVVNVFLSPWKLALGWMRLETNQRVAFQMTRGALRWI